MYKLRKAEIEDLYSIVENRGIYYGLPTYSPSITGLKALVFDANGISGSYMLRALFQAPERWEQVTAFSRRPPIASKDIGNNVKHADVIFFFAYIQPPHPAYNSLWSNAEEMSRTGAKNYGVHLRLVHSPAIESDPRVLIEPNFYYVQEDMLFEYCRENNVKWNIVRSASILGAVEGAAMNSVYALAVYIVVQKYKGEKLIFPSDSRVAKWHGMEFTYPKDDTTDYYKMTLPYEPPRGFGLPTTIRFKFTFVQWAQRLENQDAWKELAQKYSLKGSPFGPDELERTFEYLDFAVLAPNTFTFSLTKGRKIGWNGFLKS
ncbi:NAD dependent epimerase/dehydratase family protein [Leptodontidium sp. MPI-SDFR-AT-0119]|nr:NAD dependent epimerase/dehydratase family protein [Leptodontidium sp. MPI-SDFR-AT-0119]